MDKNQKLNRLQAKAIAHGFSVERDGNVISIGKAGFSYMFRTDIDDTQLSILIQNSESFIDDLVIMGK